MNQRWWITRTSQAEFTGWRMGNTHFFWANSRHLSRFMTTYGYGSIPIDTFLVGWTSIYQLFWCSPGVQGFDTLPYVKIRQSWSVMSHKDTRSIKQEYHGIDHQQHDFWCCLEVGYIYIYIPQKVDIFHREHDDYGTFGCPMFRQSHTSCRTITVIWSSSQWEFQDPKMEVLYHIRPYFVGIFPEI